MKKINNFLDWENIEEVNAFSQNMFLKLLCDKVLLKSQFQNVLNDNHLFSLCEHYDILDKIVIYDDPINEYRIRLHLFLPGYIDRPHNHRWTYSSYIIKGFYKHFIYGSESQFDKTNIKNLKPTMIRNEYEGSSYTLHHTLVHSIVAEPYTVSIVLRGPAVKDKFFIYDKSTKKFWHQFGAQHESKEEKLKKVMTKKRFQFIYRKLHEIEVI